MFPTSAQTPQALMGGAVSGSGVPFLQRQVYCNSAKSICSPILAVPPANFAGGTAYEPGREIIWDSDGVRLTGVRVDSVPPCRPVCTPTVVPGLPASALVTGLAFADAPNKVLFVADSTPEIMTLLVPPTTACPIFQARCSLANIIPAGHRPGGLAYSEKHKVLFYSSSNFAGGPAMNVVYAAPSANPCAPLCKFVPPSCTGFVLGPITGLAYDDGRNALYLTDGKALQRFVIVPSTAGCQPQPVDCCTAPVVGPYYGLELEPSHATQTGAPCTSAPCPACPLMELDAAGDPVVGNATFALQLTNSPASGSLFAFLGAGPCTAGIPVFCGLFHPSWAPVSLGSVPLGGSGPCNGSAAFPLPIPASYALIGITVCVQGVVVCTPGVGLGLTNALGLQITDN
jgi:hypothetical protein